jgi:hypothetical protein
MVIRKNSYECLHGVVRIVPRLLAGPPKNHGSIPRRGKRFFSFPKHPDLL